MTEGIEDAGLADKIEASPTASPVGEVGEIARMIEDLRTHAYDDCGERYIPTHIAHQAAAMLERLAASPAGEVGEPVAWIQPDWKNPANFTGMSPVTVYPRNDWLPLYLAASEKPPQSGDSTEAMRLLRNAALDALSGWRYIRRVHGDLPGVGWDRVENALDAALAKGGAA